MYKTSEKTLFIGKNLIHVPTCGSTNDLAISLLQQAQAAEGTVVITDHQTAGRGQRGNQWQAEAQQNLTFSIVLRPLFLPVKDQFYLTICTALAISDYLQAKALPDVKIKWPNDILCQKKKICGVLIENQIQGQSIVSSIVGIGLNIKQQSFQSSMATSLYNVTKQEYSLPEELLQLLSYVEARYLMLRSGKKNDLLQNYLSNLFQLNETCTYRSNNALFQGIIRGIDPWGKLIVETNHGSQYFDLKEISYEIE